jgi:pyridoxine 4-dehydrogenase
MDEKMTGATLGSQFTFPGTSLTVRRIGYGAMQLAGPGVWGPPKDPDVAIAVLRDAVAGGVNHIIPGTSSIAHLRENLASGRLTLSPQVLAELDRIAASAAPVEH